MLKPSEQAQIDFIVDCLRNGTRYSDVLAQFGTKWHNVSKRTFDRRYKQAESEATAQQRRINTEAEQEVKEEVNALKSKILTSFERKEYLTSIIKGEVKTKQPFVVGGKIMEYPAEPSLIDKLNKQQQQQQTILKQQWQTLMNKSTTNVTPRLAGETISLANWRQKGCMTRLFARWIIKTDARK